MMMVHYIEVTAGQTGLPRLTLYEHHSVAPASSDAERPDEVVAVVEMRDPRQCVYSLLTHCEAVGIDVTTVKMRNLQNCIVRPPSGQLGQMAELVWADLSCVTVLGYKFRPMTKHDWEGFAGAEEGTLICNDPSDRVLLWHPGTEVLSEVMSDGERLRQWDYKRTLIAP